ncbi:esterase-like activity of phytase family protein [Aurantimonas sp. MSK8Z-1]|uniref:esterase-like activity of phytase family protein n=1 Tax=Mangrovibrevibacter kandeliae TaxID=2968473 RepID=UPI0021197FB5|nr:esterase-like activity of phytase family protein [Aurantimonas sp. MSK8Z-1]MCW4116588.1 esterase-like activity of phytase family protein [Aurantimonas sp. MSK8Z-1]
MTRPLRREGAALALAVVLGLPTLAQAGGGTPVTVGSQRIERFQPGSEATRFGQLDFVGGIQFWGTGLHGLSALRFTRTGRFLAVSDDGLWFAGRIERDGRGRPTGIFDARTGPLLDAKGEPFDGKTEADAESLAIDGDRMLVGFERDHRILAYSDPDSPFDRRPETLPLPVPRAELRRNRGLETIAVSPTRAPLGGAAVTVSERSLDADGNLFAAIFQGGRRNGVFKVKRDDPWDVSDGTFLPGGDLLLLERRYTGLGRLGIRIRRIAGASVRAGALLDGPVIFEADLGEEIDNMEGLEAWTAPDGSTRLTMISDDNGSMFQRNLILEFRLVEDRAGPQ